MKSSRFMVLAALLVAPAAVFASETPEKIVEAPAEVKVITPGMLAKIRTNVVNGTDTIAEWSCNIPLRYLAKFEALKGGKFENSIPVVGRVIVVTAAIYAALKAVEAYNDAQQVENEDDIFASEDL